MSPPLHGESLYVEATVQDSIKQADAATSRKLQEATAYALGEKQLLFSSFSPFRSKHLSNKPPTSARYYKRARQSTRTYLSSSSLYREPDPKHQKTEGKIIKKQCFRK